MVYFAQLATLLMFLVFGLARPNYCLALCEYLQFFLFPLKKTTQHGPFGRIGFSFKQHIQFIDDVGFCYFLHKRLRP